MNKIHTTDHFGATECIDRVDSPFPFVLMLLVCPPGVAVLGKPSRSQGDSEILEPGEDEMTLISNTEFLKMYHNVLFGQ